MATLSAAARNAATDAVCALVNGGNLVLQTSADAEVATLPLSATAFANAVAGVAAANAVTDDTSTQAGTVAKAVLQNSSGATIITLTVSDNAGSGDVKLTSLAFAAGETVSISAMTYTTPES